jgi:hypothetical protein
LARAIYIEPVDALPASIEYLYGFAADGPDYGVGPPAIPVMIDAGYQPPHIFVMPENYGKRGPIPDRSNKWLANACPWTGATLVNMPQYNSATPQGLFHLKVDNADQYARWQVNTMATDPGVPAPIPATYASAGAATLYEGR